MRGGVTQMQGNSLLKFRDSIKITLESYMFAYYIHSMYQLDN